MYRMRVEGWLRGEMMGKMVLNSVSELVLVGVSGVEQLWGSVTLTKCLRM